MVYGCDPAWWRHKQGLPKFAGLKLTHAQNHLDPAWGVRPVIIAKGKDKKFTDDFQFAPVGTVGSGGNSGYQALNLAVQFGSSRILLVGFDMSDRSGVHWYGRNYWPAANNPNETNFKRWICAFEKAAPLLEKVGVEVINASPSPAMKCFPRRSIEDTLAAWA